MKVKHSTDTCQCIIANKMAELGNIEQAINDLAVEWNISAKLKGQLNLVVEEVVSNIVKYAYADSQEHFITVEFCNEGSCIEIRVEDDGKMFNLLEFEEKPDIKASVEDREIGGLGIHIVTTLMDSVYYKRTDNKNVLILTKNFT